jgi:hypothetical protein
MSIWTTSAQKTEVEAAEALSHSPSGGRVNMWLLGVGLALLPLGYGVQCLLTGQARLWGSNGADLDLYGSDAVALAIACISVAAFIHFHWFWGLHRRLLRFSQSFKIIAVLVFLGSVGYMFYKVAL